MKRRNKFMYSALLLSSIALLGACGSSNDTNSSDGGGKESAEVSGNLEFEDPGTLNIYFFNEGKNVDKVVKKFEDETKDTLNTKLNFNWTTDHKQEMPLKFTAKEPVDLTFDAYWQNLAKNKGDKVYADLSGYLENDDYPGLKKAFSPDLLDLVREADGSIYSLPLVQLHGGNQAQGFIVDGKLRKKYNLPEVTDEETYKQFLDTMYEHQEEEGLTSVMSLWGVGWSDFLAQKNEKLANNIVTVSNFDVQLNEDATKVVGVLGVGDDDDAAKDFAGDFQGTNYLRDRFKLFADEYGKYVDENALNPSDTGVSKNASTFTFLSEWPSKKIDAEEDGQEPELYIAQEEISNGEGKVYEDMTSANNFMVVPAYSKNIDRTMAFLNWVYASQENWDLWNYGIEGEDFEAVGDKEYNPLSPSDKYSFPVYEMTDNATYTRIDSSLDDRSKEMFEFVLDENNFEPNPLAGFMFDAAATPMISQSAASYNTIYGDYSGYFATGLYGDTFDKKYDEFVKRSEKDAKVMKEEIETQVQAFLDARN